MGTSGDNENGSACGEDIDVDGGSVIDIVDGDVDDGPPRRDTAAREPSTKVDLILARPSSNISLRCRK